MRILARGPSGQGLAAGKGYVDKWSDTQNVKWKTKLETTGNGSPIVWANRIFITIGAADGTKRGIAAFDRANGRKRWETYAPDTTFELTNLKNGYASSTPTTDGRLVFERTVILQGTPQTNAQLFKKIS